MKESLNLGPVEISYVAAVRGLKPRAPGTAFTYARTRCEQPEFLLCLAASNPDGQFLFAFDHADDAAAARQIADDRDVKNATVVHATCENFGQQLEQNKAKFPALDYLCCDASTLPLTDAERAALVAAAEKSLTKTGLFVLRYQPQARQDDHLGYLLSVYGPELKPDQLVEFLNELQSLGGYCFSRSGALRSAFDVAKASQSVRPLETCLGRLSGRSETVETFKAMSGKKLMYVGDGQVADNFLELSTPALAHDLLVQLQNTVLYEAIKDYATDRLVRCDIWTRSEVNMTDDLVARFGEFTFGIVDPRALAQTSVTRNGRTYDLSLPVFVKLVEMMRVMPIAIGDFMEQHKNSGIGPQETVNAVQFLVALGIATPMRDSYAGYQKADYVYPRAANSFTRATLAMSLKSGGLLAASTVVGRPIVCDAREAVVLQAITRSGVPNSAGLLLPELERLARDPQLSTVVLGGQMPSDAVAQSMIREICEQGMTSWYALGVLAA